MTRLLIPGKSLPERIKSFRLCIRYTQQQLAEVLGVWKESICHWEKGLHNPDPGNLQKLLRLLDEAESVL